MRYIIVNSGLALIFMSVGKNTSNAVLAFCVYLFVAGIVNVIMVQTDYSLHTKRGRAEMIRHDKAQREYDRKYRNYVKEAKAKKGTIEYTEKKR